MSAANSTQEGEIVMDGINKNNLDMFNKIKWLMSLLCTFIVFIVGTSIMSLIKFYYSGGSLNEYILFGVLLYGVGAMTCWVLIYNRIQCFSNTNKKATGTEKLGKVVSQ